MAAGIRIEPQPDRHVPDNALIVVTDKARPIPPLRNGQPDYISDRPVCHHCGIPHLWKTYHIQLDDGAAIVSTTIWNNLQTLIDNGGFRKVNVVEHPPDQHLEVRAR
jgi:hypothetical protein